jgi:hypothetical protein
MSYDFRLFLSQPGVDPVVTAEGEADEGSEEINPGPPIPAKEARKRAIANALIKADPALEIFRFGFDEIAKFQNVGVEEARLRFRHLELNDPEGGPGIQIVLFDDSASVIVPYWHNEKKAKAVFAQIWEYLKVISDIAGYDVYDPQLECIINLNRDLERAAKRYTDLVKRIIG